MDKRERMVELTRYYPEYLKGYPEMQHTAAAEGKEIDRLYGVVDSLWSNGYIQTADYTGMKRWESLLRVKPSHGDSLEERRARVLLIWNQQLPYTLPRLKERLDAAAGEGNYEICLDYPNYILRLMLYPAQSQVQRMVRNMVVEMIPANLLFDMGTLCPSRKTVIHTGAVRTKSVRMRAAPDAGQRNVKKIAGMDSGVGTFEHIKVTYPPAEKEI